jgi:hypothetical protein
VTRGQHAFSAHEALRDTALADLLFFSWAARRPARPELPCAAGFWEAVDVARAHAKDAA